ncbi:MAG: hypothetical protein IKQ49_06375 [Eubacterium sp.]|nr:hypothetical protein [Eubacterium sp.]MBR6172781.1 hypothetical protein [Eubacterium sp.]
MKNIAAVVMILALLAELYLMTAGSQHKRKKLIKGWNPTRGVIRAIEKKQDNVGASRKSYTELTIEAESGQKVYARVGNMCIYEVGEEVDLMEKDGYHRFRGNDRVDAKGKKELFWGIIPMLVLIAGIAALSLAF